MGFRGFGAAGGAAVLFGIMYVPVKKHDIHDGSVFQFFLCNGVCIGTFWFVIGYKLIAFGTLPELTLLLPGFVGGVIWSVSNALTIPLVKLMGLGVGFSMYHVINLMTGYGVGRFGISFVGLSPDDAVMPWLQDLGVCVLVVSLLLLLAVEMAAESGRPCPHPEDVEVNSHAVSPCPTQTGGAASVSGLDGISGPAPGPERSAPLRPSSAGERREMLLSVLATDAMGADPVSSCVGEQSSVRRLFIAVPLAVAAGVSAGLNSVPFAIWSKAQERHGLEIDLLAYLFSAGFGIWFTSISIYLICAVVMWVSLRSKPLHTVIRPALAAGVCWSLGNMLMLVGIQDLGFAAGYSLDAVGPIMIASIIAFFFGEIRQGMQLNLFVIAVVLQTAGVVMIAVGNGK